MIATAVLGQYRLPEGMMCQTSPAAQQSAAADSARSGVRLSFAVSRWNLKLPGIEVYTNFMNLPLKDMTLQEKLATMELLWEDLSRSPESVESPNWHKDILDERRERVAEGKARFVDWETAKKDVRNKVS
jgi:hypothetical protein